MGKTWHDELIRIGYKWRFGHLGEMKLGKKVERYYWHPERLQESKRRNDEKIQSEI